MRSSRSSACASCGREAPLRRQSRILTPSMHLCLGSSKGSSAFAASLTWTEIVSGVHDAAQNIFQCEILDGSPALLGRLSIQYWRMARASKPSRLFVPPPPLILARSYRATLTSGPSKPLARDYSTLFTAVGFLISAVEQHKLTAGGIRAIVSIKYGAVGATLKRRLPTMPSDIGLGAGQEGTCRRAGS